MTELEKANLAAQIACAQRNEAMDKYLSALVEINVLRKQLADRDAAEKERDKPHLVSTS